MENNFLHPEIPRGSVTKTLLGINIIMAFVYFSWWLLPGKAANPLLYDLLLFGEGYHVLSALLFWSTLWPSDSAEKKPDMSPLFQPSVAVFITVAGEPVDVVEKTVIALKDVTYKNLQIYILNDGFVAKKENWYEIEMLAKRLRVNCITRKIPGGAKAGNINNALQVTKSDLVAVFDADMVPFPDFFQKTIPYFIDKHIGFVQTPQYYKNFFTNDVTKGAWEQQQFFFGPIMAGKNKSNSAFLCGTNFVIRRSALLNIHGMCETSIAEDFLTSLFLHQNGWKSVYVPDVLSEGLAPEDFLSYYKQQFRWCRGSLEVLFGQNPFFKKGLTFRQKIQYFFSAFYYLNGIIVLIDCLIPLLFLFTGLVPVSSTTTSFALFFIPFIFLNLYTLYQASDQSITFRAISFSQSSFVLQLSALKSLLFREKTGFDITSKKKLEGNFLNLVYPHLLYIALTFLGVIVAFHREGMNASVATNIAWAAFNCVLFFPFIQAAYDWKKIFL